MITFWLIIGITLGISILSFLLNRLVFNGRIDGLRNLSTAFLIISVIIILVGFVVAPFPEKEYYKADEVSRSKSKIFVVNHEFGSFHSGEKFYYDLPDSLLCIKYVQYRNFYTIIIGNRDEKKICKCDEKVEGK